MGYFKYACHGLSCKADNPMIPWRVHKKVPPTSRKLFPEQPSEWFNKMTVA